jgi:Mn2+/Fe2+ NRAMP family transporter
VRVEMPVAPEAAPPPLPTRAWRWLPFLLALGPGVIGLCADNDAGGMLSYAVTGASHGLVWLLPALVALAVPTFFVQAVALRVAQASGLPYSKVLIATAGVPLARLEALVLYALNAVTLVTEFVGMALALALAGVPPIVSAPLTFGLVVALTSSRIYPRIEELLLRVAVATIAFLPALLLLHHRPTALAAAFAGRVGDPWFLLLALAGNTLAPWMIYWQQNAVWAGAPRTPRQRLWDLLTGQVAMVVMASAVLLLGALTPGNAAAWASPLAWIAREGGAPAGGLFAVGIFAAGLLAACTISLASLWTLREAMGAGARHPEEAPNRGAWRTVHLLTLALAAAVVLWPGLAAGTLALWAQALGAIWMPVTLLLLFLVARDRRRMGNLVLGPWAQAALALLAAGYLSLGLRVLVG